MRMLRTTGGLKALLLASGACTAVWSMPVLAQSSSGTDEASNTTIVVTGSRIARPDYVSNSPSVSISEEILQQSTTSALEVNLNKLPQFTPNQTPTLGMDIQPSATNTPGAATISLRGIGSNRTLVLIDGRRGTPANASGVTDISTIPSAAIERVEIISGGASATYGADAIAGVTNFILKKNFVGLDLDGSMSLSQEGDGFEYNLSGIMGTDFADGRGNISLALSMNTREASYQRDRKWYRDMWADPNKTNGAQFFMNYPAIMFDGALSGPPFGTGNPATGLGAMFPNTTFDPTASGYSAGMPVFINPDGSLFVNQGDYTDAFGFVGAPGGYYNNNVEGYTGPVDGYHYKVLANGTLQQNNTDLYLVFPMTRYNAYARGNYEINEWLGVFGQAMFSHVETYTKNEPAPLFNFWNVAVDPDGLDRDQLPEDMWTLLESRADPGAPFFQQTLLPTERETFTDVMTYNITAGLEGSVPGTDWTWEAFINHGVSSTFARQTGTYSLQRMRAIMSSPNFGAGFNSSTTINPATGEPYGSNGEYGFIAANTASCTSGLNPFIIPAGGYSADCIDAVQADLKNRSDFRQTVAEANLQGGLFELPAGQLRFALGASYREMDYEYINDTLTSQGRGFLDQAVGIYPTSDSFGAIDVKEAYGELLIPILSDIPLIQELNLEVGGRMSDYSTTGTSWTYKILGDWQATDWLRFRGGYNVAERAPNIAELFLSAQQSFGFSFLGDPCSAESTTSISANPDNANGANVRQICEILMAQSGNPNASTTFYSQTHPFFGFGIGLPTLSGNPNLEPERAKTWTAGAVIQSPVSGGPLSRLRLSVDWFDISVTDAIGAQSYDLALRLCYDPVLNPLAGTDPVAAAATAACQNLPRLQNGEPGNVNTSYVNSGRFHVQGIDAQLDWGMDVGPGMLNANVVASYMIDFESAGSPGEPLVDYVGSGGVYENGLGAGFFNNALEYRITTNLGYTWGPANINLNWQHFPGWEDNAEVTGGEPTPTTGSPSYNVFALSGGYRVSENVGLRFTVDNLFNKAPPYTGVNPEADLSQGQLPGGSFSLNHDTLGRRFSLGANVKF